MRLASPLPRSPDELRELQAQLEHEVVLAVRRGATREDLAAVLLVLAAVDRKLNDDSRADDDADVRPSLRRRQQLAAERRPTVGNGR